MKSWKARLLILATMLAMLIALAAPASADHDDWDVVEFCAEISNTWEEFEDCLEWFEERDAEDASSGDVGSGDAGSGDAGSGSYWEPYLNPDWLYYY